MPKTSKTASIQSAKIYKRTERLMGNRFEISVVRNAGEAELAEQDLQAAVAEIQRIEKLLTTYSTDSQTNQINANAGIAPVKVDREIFGLIKRSNKISSITQGAFDLSYGSLDKSLWNFDQTMDRLPSAETAKKLVRLINYQNIVLDEKNQTVFLKEVGMRIGFGGIGKGYAADRAKMVLQQRGVVGGIVNASGDLIVWGKQPSEKHWTIGIANPNIAGLPFSYLELDEMAIATSGNYEKFAVVNGKKYSHTIDPNTGFPVSGIKSVSVLSPIAELADAMTTPVMVMGVGPGLNMVNQVQHIECIIIDDQNKIHTSKNIKLHL